jgi:hypothetical protein
LSLFEAIDVVFACDLEGATDKTGKDVDELRMAVQTYFEQLDEETRRKSLALYARKFLADEAINSGYGLEDVMKFINWVEKIFRNNDLYKSNSCTIDVGVAIDILNHFQHRGHSGWYLRGNPPSFSVVQGQDYYESFTPYEAIAIAEKYLLGR